MDMIAKQMNGRDAFVFDPTEEQTWHRKGVEIPESIARDPAAIAALCGADYHVSLRPVSYESADGAMVRVPNRSAIIRDDNGYTMGIQADSWKAPQPVEYFEAYRDALGAHGLRISSAGVLKGGKIVFVNARMPDFDTSIGETTDDTIRRYICIGGGYDGTLANFGYASDLRTVCYNTLSANLGAEKIYRSFHCTEFDGKALATALGACGAEFKLRADVYNTLAGKKMAAANVAEYFARVVGIDPADINRARPDGKPVLSGQMRGKLDALALAYTQGPGATLATASGTIFGALNAVTYYVDHAMRATESDTDSKSANRFYSATFGDGARTKARALDLAMTAAGIKVANGSMVAIAA